MRRTAPDGFGSVDAGQQDRTLVYKGQRLADLLFVVLPDRADAVTLAPGVTPAFERFLRSLGLEAAAVAAFSRRDHFLLDQQECLPLEHNPKTCASLALGTLGAADLELRVASGHRLTGQDAPARPALIGSTQLALSGGAQVPSSAMLGMRGIASRGTDRLEYDFSWRSRPGSGENSLRWNVLALATQLRAADGTPRGYLAAGSFQAAAAGTAFGASPAFLSRPAMGGLAFQSDYASLQPFGRRRQLRVVLESPALVRVIQARAVVLERQLPPGEHILRFEGASDPFAELEIRDATGVRSQQAETRPDDSAPEAALGPVQGSRGFFYLDAGRLLEPSAFRLSDATALDAGFAWVGDAIVLHAAGQAVGGHRRLALAAAQRDGSWQAHGMAGSGGETGLLLQASQRLSDFSVTLAGTRYRPPRADAGTDCTRIPNPCFSRSAYQSAQLSLGHQRWPVRMGLSYSRVGAVSTSLLTWQAGLSLPRLRPGAMLMLVAMTDPRRRSRYLGGTLFLPLDGAALNTSLTTTDGGRHGATVAWSARLPDTELYSRATANLVAQAAWGGGMASQSASGFFASQAGIVDNSSGFNLSRAGGLSAFSTLTAGYALTAEGLAIARSPGVGQSANIFAADGEAGLAVFNEGSEPQTMQLEQRLVEVAPGSQVLVPLPSGYLRSVAVLPGPLENEDALTAQRMLHKGNVREIRIEKGFWAIASYLGPDGHPVPAAFTWKRSGAKVERLYRDARGRSVVYETADAQGAVVRFLGSAGSRQVWRCEAPAVAPAATPAAAPGETQEAAMGYREVAYRCELLK